MGTARLTLLEPPRAARQPDYLPIRGAAGRSPSILPHGRTPCVRPVTHGDTALLADLIARMSDDARWQRFAMPLPSAELIWRAAARVAQREPQLGVALVATAPERGQVRAVALAELAHDPAAPGVAELAEIVRDDQQRKGVGTLLVRRLIELARQRGVRALRATLWAENWAARNLLRNLGLDYRSEIQHGELTAWADLL